MPITYDYLKRPFQDRMNNVTERRSLGMGRITCNLGKGMGMRIVTREYEGMGMSECGKIPAPHSTDTEEQL